MLLCSAVEGAPGGSLVPFGFTTKPTTACTPGDPSTTCHPPYLQCNTAQQACTCAAGVDTCYGYCIPTPCGACNGCVKTFRDFTARVKSIKDAAIVAREWATACAAAGRTSTSCELVRQQILSSVDGNMGKRVGMLCQLLQVCTQQTYTAWFLKAVVTWCCTRANACVHHYINTALEKWGVGSCHTWILTPLGGQLPHWHLPP
jgi:hypothetical protein